MQIFPPIDNFYFLMRKPQFQVRVAAPLITVCDDRNGITLLHYHWEFRQSPQIESIVKTSLYHEKVNQLLESDLCGTTLLPREIVTCKRRFLCSVSSFLELHADCNRCTLCQGCGAGTQISGSGSSSGHLNFFAPAPTSKSFCLRLQNDLVD